MHKISSEIESHLTEFPLELDCVIGAPALSISPRMPSSRRAMRIDRSVKGVDVRRDITKIGLAVMDGDRVLLVKKRGSDFLILPGGKPEKSETDAQTLSRELEEELGCHLVSDQLIFLGTFSDEAAGMPGVNVTIRLYVGSVVGTPIPHAEIESIVWWAATERHSEVLAPSLKNSILPFLNSSLSERNYPQRLTNSANLP